MQPEGGRQARLESCRSNRKGRGEGREGAVPWRIKATLFSSRVNAASVQEGTDHGRVDNGQQLKLCGPEAEWQAQLLMDNVCSNQAWPLNIFKVMQARLVRAYLFLPGLVPFCWKRKMVHLIYFPTNSFCQLDLIWVFPPPHPADLWPSFLMPVSSKSIFSYKS